MVSSFLVERRHGGTTGYRDCLWRVAKAEELLLSSGLLTGGVNRRRDAQEASCYSQRFSTRPPMLDRTDFESWQQVFVCMSGKDNGENIMKSIKEGPFQMGTVSDVITGGTEGAVQQGPVRARVLNDLSADEKERYKADIRATNILLQGISLFDEYEHFASNQEKAFKDTTGLKESNFDQLYAYLKQHEVHANENKIMIERFSQPNNDPLALVSDGSVQQYPTQSAKSP
ncbi:hypothetical protein Tco_1505380 [Tanacetum coccineum]